MPMRNPFARRPGVVIPTGAADQSQTSPHPGFERVDTVGSKASSILSIRSNRSHEAGEYKMSGEYWTLCTIEWPSWPSLRCNDH